MTETSPQHHPGLIGAQPEPDPQAVRSKVVRQEEGFPTFWLIAPASLWLILFLVVPLASIIIFSFWASTPQGMEPDFSLSNYGEYFAVEGFFDPEADRFLQPSIFVRTLWNTVYYTLLVMLICLIVGYPVALVIATAEQKWKPWLLLIIILPFWTNLLIRTYALLNILGTRGRVNEFLGWIWDGADGLTGGMLGAFEPIKFLGTDLGVIIGLVYVALPFAVLPIYSALERLDRSYLEASLDLGAGQFRTFFKVLLPLTAAGVTTAAIITFIPMLGSFLTPDLLGRGQVDMIANVIERQFKKANDWPFGSALSLFLLYVTFIILAVRSMIDMHRSKGRRH